MRPLEDPADLTQVMEADVAILYKHSPVCSISRAAMEEVRRFVERRPDVPVFVMDVVRQRELARRTAEQLGIRHQSPQVIVLRGGAPQHDASHRQITAQVLEEWTRSAERIEGR